MAPRSSSPTSLLWAHQLKREHGYLLKRMQDLESANEKHENRIKTAESTAKSNAGGDFAALEDEVKALDQKFKQGLNGMEKDVTQKLDDVQVESEAMTMQIAALQKDERVAEEERKESLAKDKALLRRIAEVEDGLKKYGESLDRIGKRVNETQFESIMERLESLTKRVMEEGSQMKLLAESVRVLETANAEISRRNAQLEADLRKKAEKTPVSPQEEPEERAVEGAEVDPTAQPGDAAKPPKKQKKSSHKWGGGGADKVIILAGSSLLGDSPIVNRQPSPEAAPKPKKSTQLPRKPPVPKKKKPAVPKTPSADSDRKSHKWAGGGADRAIIAQGLPQEPVVKREHSIDNFSPVPSKKARTSISGIPSNERVVRAGKGWIEVSRTPSPESQESSEPTKRGRGRPRKLPKRFDDDPPAKRARGRPRKYGISPEHGLPAELGTNVLPSRAPTRRTIDQGDDDNTSKKRKADVAFGGPVQEKLGQVSKHQKSATEPEAQAVAGTRHRRRERHTFSSPMSSSPPLAIGKEGSVIAQPAPAPPKVRREIIQSDDDVTEIVRAMSA